MATRAESDQELADNLSDISDNQAAALASTGRYAPAETVPGAPSLSITEYTGGGPRPAGPLRDPGYLICQHATEDGVDFMRCIAYGISGRTMPWSELDDQPDLD